MKALIIGGGVAGLSAAVGLQRVGIGTEVFERAPEIRDIGAGKSVWRNGLQALAWLGLTDEVTASGSPVDEIRVLWRGRTLHRIPVGRLGASIALERQQVLGPLAQR